MKIPDQKSALDQTARKKGSHALDTDVGYVAEYYRDRADTYDLHVGSQGYCGPIVVAELAGAVQTAYLAKERAAVTILDAGCGTGLVGLQLQRLGFQLIDGFDLIGEMAEKARQTRIYRHVTGGVDLNGPLSEYPNASYDVTVCCGVFTHRHARPDGLRELARVTRPNGFVIASTRKSYAEATSFEDEVRRLQDAGLLMPALCLSDARYYEENAHYWAFQVLDKARATGERL
ncbi:MAG: methyltransferase domain-containing protein [Mesorhizobium sp.]|nr:class I SAM-dependent methyltransferase [Mesorhizobium sp. M7A.F.Ca.ET.027.02.1.1]RWC97172.1 MAG: class I SAM-dependent methyltransferase [Mesorhizobium sp.]RVD13100.1 class I SAM-dependent methyltransferase [Mesorhizobium sp. M7A.F.Ca.ET.027.02.1.1]TIT29994.1 MAG: methyltransferase domain-containing protein [Mesorhizobium sp.]TIX97899.1 MAG: methyltransferase domain-containing protein [Mesorhizobium sp.]TIY03741.1 MAG: methyltransferase domain-containing protein [Mesorhizobium sp.]